MGHRKERVEELIKRIVSEVILKEINDPRVGFVSVSAVKLNKDFSVAEIGVSVLGGSQDIRKAFIGLQSARGYIQKYVAKNIRLRIVPKIDFFLDSSVAEGVRMVNLIESLEGESDKPSEEI